MLVLLLPIGTGKNAFGIQVSVAIVPFSNMIYTYMCIYVCKCAYTHTYLHMVYRLLVLFPWSTLTDAVL